MTNYKRDQELDPTLPRRLRQVLEVLALISVIIACGTVSWSALRSQKAAMNSLAPSTGAAWMTGPSLTIDPRKRLGSADAPFTLFVFSDFHCPFCSKFALDSMPFVKSEIVRTGRASVVFKHMPLEQIHPEALSAAVLAECAASQGEFWNAHDAIFGIGVKSFTELLKEPERLRLDRQSTIACLADTTIRERVNLDVSEAETAGITGTPTIVIAIADSPDTARPIRRVTGARSAEQLLQEIQSVAEREGR